MQKIYKVGDPIEMPFKHGSNDKTIIHKGTVLQVTKYFVLYRVNCPGGVSYKECFNMRNVAMPGTNGLK